MTRGVQTPIYRKPYPEWVDRVHEYPRGFRIPDFTLFYGTGNQSTVEHIARFAAQCGEFTNHDYMKLRLFPNSLTGGAFVWYINLTPGSIQNWQQMEEAFHAQFFQSEPEVSMADLARLSQRPEEKATQFIARFKRARNKCRVILPEPEFVRLAQNGLEFRLRKKFDSTEFRDLVKLTYKVSRYEALLEEEQDRNNASYKTYYRDPNYEIDTAEIVGKEPVICEALIHKDTTIDQQFKKKDFHRKYSFDLTKADDIFDHWLAANFLKLPKGVKLLSPDELKGKIYCKWHNSWSHSTKNCIVFRDRIQEQIRKRSLKFPTKTEKIMGIDSNPFPEVGEGTANVVVPNFQNLSLQELEEVNVQMHTANQTTAKKETRNPPAIGRGFSHQKEQSDEEALDDNSLEAAVMQRMCPRCRLSHKWLRGLPIDGKQYYRDVQRHSKPTNAYNKRLYPGSDR
ncbi:hypothetical protein CsSME_00011926 [Camellia sinensis var. sinensis]